MRIFDDRLEWLVQRMTAAQWQEFLSVGTRTGKVGLVRPGGQVHLTPVWFLVDPDPDGPDIIFTTWRRTVKGRSLRPGSDFSLCVDEQAPPYSYVTASCTVTEVGTDPEELLAWAVRIADRYMGPERAGAYGARNAVPGELLVRARITSVTAFLAVAD
jgi:PPOX class probable F420-dependent enzyme